MLVYLKTVFIRRHVQFLSFSLIFLCLSGCRSLGPSYHPPSVEVPEEWKTSLETNVKGEFCRAEKWWEIFKDPILNELEERAIRNNMDVQAAFQRILKERSIADNQRSKLLPQVNLDPSYQNTGVLIELYGFPTSIAEIPGAPPFSIISRTHQVSLSLPIDLNYELDLWGKLKHQYQSSLLSLEAKELAWCSLILTLTSDLANAYFQMRTLDTQLELLQKVIESRKETLEINESRWKSGLAAYTDVTQAATLVYSAESDYINMKRRRILKENMIATLIGAPASNLAIESNPLTAPPPQIPSGIPSSILLKRPDIIEAERMAASEHALIKSAYASFFPSISLTGSLGFVSPVLEDFLDWKSRLWSFGAEAVQHIFDGGRRCSNLDLAKARFCEASFQYQKKVVTAFQEVEDALANLKYRTEAREVLEKKAISAKETSELSNTRYLKGIANYLEVSISERTELEVQISKTDLLGWQYISTIQLVKALGGAWDNREGFCSD